jgi:ABC-type dipeptide/oligopeptide/nickel transport system ATPase subunit
MEIIGIVGSFKTTFKLKGMIKELNVKDINKALKIVSLDESFLDKVESDLTLSQLWKVELLSKLEKSTIVVGSLSNNLNYKDQEFFKKLLLKLNKDYNKKIVVIDNNIDSFINLVDRIYITKKMDIIYSTNNFFDDELYKYVNMPKIVEFIKYVNKDEKRLENNTDIYELIKDIYRVVS